MRIPHVPLLITALLISSPLSSSGADEAPAAALPTLREAALENMLSERGTLEAMNAAVTSARKSGVTEQAILEARFLYHVDRHEDDQIAALVPEFLKLRDSFKSGDSAIFAEKEDWLAVIEYAQALAAIRKGDKAAFKTHITEAFWLSPQQAGAFSEHIERIRLEEAMSAVTIDFSSKFQPLAAESDPVTLKSIMADQKALLLHFWSAESPECEASLPDFAITAESLSTKGIAAASLVPYGKSESLTKPRSLIKPITAKGAGSWLIDSDNASLARLLRIKNVPAMVLVSSEGKILFNGEPSDNGFWNALQKIDPRILRPDTTKEDHDNKSE